MGAQGGSNKATFKEVQRSRQEELLPSTWAGMQGGPITTRGGKEMRNVMELKNAGVCLSKPYQSLNAGW